MTPIEKCRSLLGKIDGISNKANTNRLIFNYSFQQAVSYVLRRDFENKPDYIPAAIKTVRNELGDI